MIKNLLSFIFQGNYILNYLATRPKLVHYVLQALVQVKKKKICVYVRLDYSIIKNNIFQTLMYLSNCAMCICL